MRAHWFLPYSAPVSAGRAAREERTRNGGPEHLVLSVRPDSTLGNHAHADGGRRLSERDDARILEFLPDSEAWLYLTQGAPRTSAVVIVDSRVEPRTERARCQCKSWRDSSHVVQVGMGLIELFRCDHDKEG